MRAGGRTTLLAVVVAGAWCAVNGVALLCSCGGGGTRVDESGVVEGGEDLQVFARASQYYFRGNLTRAEEEFNRLLLTFEDSPLAEDAGLAVRRIGQDTTESLPGDSTPEPSGTGWPVVALVGHPGTSRTMERLELAFRSTGILAEVIEDEGAPDMTVVLYPTALEQKAYELADTLESWLTQPLEVAVQRGGGIHETIVPGHSGLLVVVGSDASVRQTAPGLELMIDTPDSTGGLDWMIR